MRPAVVCPSVFHFPHADGIPSATGVSAFLEKWFALLKTNCFAITFSPSYVSYLKQKWFPILNPNDADMFSKQPCWCLILAAAGRYSFSSPKKGKGICSCTHSIHPWIQQLNELKDLCPVIVSDNCKISPQGFEVVCSETELLACYPEKWLSCFRKNEWRNVPLQGEMCYVPPKNWERTGIRMQTKRYATGYPDRKNAIWSYDKTEKHWDVFLPDKHVRCRVTPEGKILDTKSY